MRNVVVLPQPEGPSSATMLPGSIARVQPVDRAGFSKYAGQFAQAQRYRARGEITR